MWKVQLGTKRDGNTLLSLSRNHEEDTNFSVGTFNAQKSPESPFLEFHRRAQFRPTSFRQVQTASNTRNSLSLKSREEGTPQKQKNKHISLDFPLSHLETSIAQFRNSQIPISRLEVSSTSGQNMQAIETMASSVWAFLACRSIPTGIDSNEVLVLIQCSRTNYIQRVHLETRDLDVNGAHYAQNTASKVLSRFHTQSEDISKLVTLLHVSRYHVTVFDIDPSGQHSGQDEDDQQADDHHQHQPALSQERREVRCNSEGGFLVSQVEQNNR